MLLVYTLLGGSALFIMIQDVREQTIPLSGLIVFAGASLYHSLTEPNLEDFWVAGTLALIFMVCQGLAYLIKREPIIWVGGISFSVLFVACGFIFTNSLPILSQQASLPY